MKLKFSVLLLTTFCLMPSYKIHANIKESAHRLTHPIIKFIEEIVPAETIGLMLQIRRECKKILYGKPNSELKIFEGMYEFNGTLHGAVSLAKIESELDAKFYSQEDALMNDTRMHSSQEWHTIKSEYEQQKAELQKILAKIKEDFKRVSKSYVEGARGFKEQTLILIQESCKLRNLNNCFLLKWGEAEDGRETEAFENEINTFAELVNFLTDLSNFLHDMVNSCDKPREQFIANVRSHKQYNH